MDKSQPGGNRMKIKEAFFVWVFLTSCLFMQGCETTEGMKKDVKNVFYGTGNKDSQLYKADAWIREHLW